MSYDPFLKIYVNMNTDFNYVQHYVYNQQKYNALVKSA